MLGLRAVSEDDYPSLGQFVIFDGMVLEIEYITEGEIVAKRLINDDDYYISIEEDYLFFSEEQFSDFLRNHLKDLKGIEWKERHIKGKNALFINPKTGVGIPTLVATHKIYGNLDNTIIVIFSIIHFIDKNQVELEVYANYEGSPFEAGNFVILEATSDDIEEVIEYIGESFGVPIGSIDWSSSDA